MEFRGEYLITYIGCNLTAFVLLISFYVAYSKNLYNVILTHESITEEGQKKDVYKRVTLYFNFSDFTSGLTAEYILLSIALSTLFLVHMNGYQVRILGFDISNRIMAVVIIAIYSFIVGFTFHKVKKTKSDWEFTEWKNFWKPIAVYGFIDFMLIRQALTSFNWLEDFHSFLFVLIGLFCGHLLALVMVQFSVPLTYWTKAIKWKDKNFLDTGTTGGEAGEGEEG